jgi:hypothetical protein
VLGIVELYFEESIGLLINDSALRRNQIVSSQSCSPFVVEMRPTTADR